MSVAQVVDIEVGADPHQVLYSGLPVAMFSSDSSASFLERAVHMHCAQQTRRMTFPIGRGADFKYVLCYLEDRDGFVLPSDAERAVAVLEQLAYFGLIDERSGAALRTRKQLEAARRDAETALIEFKSRIIAQMMVVSLSSAKLDRATFAECIASDEAFMRCVGELSGSEGFDPENAAECRKALLDHPEYYVDALRVM